MDDQGPPIDALLRHARWIERLSLQLCRDEHRAADARQDVWLAAARTPPLHGANLRGFLATLLRNAVRLQHRRERRLQARQGQAVASGFAEAAADAAARADLHRFLMQQVLTLPEPQRALVLLHYCEGLGIGAVAARAGLSAEAVRAHLRRARGALRMRLHGDERAGAGFAAVLAATRPRLLPVLLLALPTKLALGAAGLAVAALLLWQLLPLAAPPMQPQPPTPMPAPVAAQASADAERPQAPPTPEARQALPAQRALHCQLVGLHPRAPWTAAVRVSFEGRDRAADRWEEHDERCTPDASGAFAVALPPWAERCEQFELRFAAEDPLYLPLQVRDKAPTLQQGIAGDGRIELPVQVASVVTGKVVDAQGQPVPAARVGALPWRDGRPLGGPRPQTNTAADGSFHLQAPIDGELLLLLMPMQEASLSGMRMVTRHGAITDCNLLRSDLQAGSARVALRFGEACDAGTIVLPAAATVRGSVRQAGQPLAGASLRWQPLAATVVWQLPFEHLLVTGFAEGRVHVQPAATSQQRWTTDERGQFALPAPPQNAGELRLQPPDGAAAWFVPPRPATAPCRVDFELQPTLQLRVLCAGEPVAGVGVQPEGASGDAILATDARGEVRLLREHGGPVRLRLLPPGAAAQTIEVAGDETTFVVQLPGLATVPVALEVLGDHRVRQIEGSLQPLDRDAVAIPFARFRNDGTGPFVLQAPPGRYRLHLQAPARAERRDTFPCSLDQDVVIAAGGAALEVRVRHGGRIAIDARDEHGVGIDGEVHVFAADGSEVPLPDGGRLSPVERFTTPNLPPGSYAVVLDLGRRGVQRRSIEVRMLEVTEVAPR